MPEDPQAFKFFVVTTQNLRAKMREQAKAKYTIRNWGEYNRALEQRGSLTIWFSPEAIECWLSEKQGKRGRPQRYSNDAIVCALMIKAVYHVPFRQLRGLLQSLVLLMGIILPIPCYTRICHRAQELGQTIKRLSKKVPPILFSTQRG